MASIIKLEKGHNIDQILDQHKNKIVLLYFSAQWLEECKLMSGVLQELLKEENVSNSLNAVEIEAEDFEDVSVKYGVESVPTFVFIKNKNVLQKLTGANPSELRTKLNQIIQNSSFLPTNNVEKPQEDLNTRLYNLTHSAPVILFMKGTPSEPRCGFSRQMIEILKTNNVTFSFFDILSDNEVREGLKKFSNWPTYPQLYSKGELVGGLDIVKELVATGEFASVLPEKGQSLNERLKSLINRSKVMLFMKGNANEPKCGFSRQIIELLNETGAKYDTFDILSDEEVRSGLKTYSNWPTYPQLYVDGELVGGLDIVKELKQNGELSETLAGKQ